MDVELSQDEIAGFVSAIGAAHEQRSAVLDDAEITERDDELVFEGLAATFDTRSEDLGGFREEIRRGAFRPALRSNPDVVFLGLDHNELQPLARTTVKEGPGALRLAEVPKGLEVRAHLVKTSAALDLREQVRHRVVTDMSFGFDVSLAAGGEQRWTRSEDGYALRTITKFGRLLDVTPATRRRAYSNTTTQMRSLACGVELVDVTGEVQRSALTDLAWRIHRGELAATDEERSRIDEAFARIETVSPWIAERALRATSQEPELRAAIAGKVATVTLDDVDDGQAVRYRLAARRRRLAILKTGER